MNEEQIKGYSEVISLIKLDKAIANFINPAHLLMTTETRAAVKYKGMPHGYITYDLDPFGCVKVYYRGLPIIPVSNVGADKSSLGYIIIFNNTQDRGYVITKEKPEGGY